MKGGKDRVREGIARSRGGQSEGYFMGRAGREKRKGASSHPTQSSTPIHPSSVSAQRLPLLHQHQLLVHLVHVRARVCVCVLVGRGTETRSMNICTGLSV